MSRRSVKWRQLFNQAIGNDYESDVRQLRRVIIRDDGTAADLLIPHREVVGKKSAKVGTSPMTPEKEARLRALFKGEGKGVSR